MSPLSCFWLCEVMERGLHGSTTLIAAPNKPTYWLSVTKRAAVSVERSLNQDYVT